MKEIYCECELCVYNNERECELNSISLNQIGACEDCIIPDIDKDILDKLKHKIKERLDN